MGSEKMADEGWGHVFLVSPIHVPGRSHFLELGKTEVRRRRPVISETPTRCTEHL